MKSHHTSKPQSPMDTLLSAAFLTSPFFQRVIFSLLGNLVHGSPWLQTLNCNSLLIQSKLIFGGAIPGSLLVLGQHNHNTSLDKMCYISVLSALAFQAWQPSEGKQKQNKQTKPTAGLFDWVFKSLGCHLASSDKKCLTHTMGFSGVGRGPEISE